MKHTKGQIVVLLCSVFITTFLIIFLAFRVLMDNYIEKGAAEAIHNYNDYNWVESWQYKFSPYFASGLYLEKDERTSSYVAQYSDEPKMPYKNSIVNWLSKNNVKTGEIFSAKISNRNYYISLQPVEDDPDFMLAVYVDITAEKQLVSNISLAILLIMIFCSIGACGTGVIIGKKIEKEQWKQKKIFENASHQLKTPLMVIQGYAEGLSCGIVKNQAQAAEIIMDETEKMAFLIDEILNLSRIDSNEITFSFERVSLSSIMNNCLTSIEFLADNKGISIEADITDHMIRADAVQLERAVTNILSNAVRYAKSAIMVKCDESKIEITDDGEGIADEDLENIFKRFYIGKNGNTGIGLSLTKEVVQRHGWGIYAENIRGGTRFVIKFKPKGDLQK